MKKLVIAILGAAVITGSLSGCAPGQNTGGATLLGAAAGGLLGAQLGNNASSAILGGLIGGGLGYMLGRQMDRQDQINMHSAIANTPVGEDASWTNPRSQVTYQVHPIRNYQNDGCYCREYQTRVQIGGQWRSAYGKACRMPDGQWKIVK